MMRRTLLTTIKVANASPKSRIETIPRTLQHHVVRLNSSTPFQTIPKQPLENGAVEFISFDAKTPVLLRMDDEYPGNKPPETVPSMIRNVVEKNPNSVAVAYKETPGATEWTKLTYTEYLKVVETAAKGFISLGLEEFHSVGVMASNCVQWTTSSHAAIFAGGLICGIYQTSSPDIVLHCAKMSDMDILVVEDLKMLRHALGAKKNLKEALPMVKQCVMINSSPEDLLNAQKYGPVISWQEVLRIGESSSNSDLNSREKKLEANKACMLIFTSGTTGPPKGAMLSHDNITYSSLISTRSYNWENESLMSFLPMSHVAAQMMDNYLTPFCGGTTYFADKDCLKGTLVENLKSARPTRFVGVPRVWEKIKDKMIEVEAQASPLKKAVMKWAKTAALENHDQVMAGKVKYGLEHGSLKYRLAHKLVLSKIHIALGLDNTTHKRDGRVSGAAAINQSTLDYFKSIGLFINNLYGLTESCGPCNTNTQYGGGNKDGTVGKPFWGVKIQMINVDPDTKEGEVSFYTRNTFMGYIQEEAKTRSTFTENGVLCKTGDLGILTPDGHLQITGRIKELIITEGGKNVAPVPIEEAIKSKLSSIVSQAMVVGDSKRYLSCLFTLQVAVDPQTLLPTDKLNPGATSWCKEVLGESAASNVQSVSDFIKGQHADQLRSAIQKAIDDYNQTAETQVHQVKKFCILPNDFSMQGGELGPTLKLKRHVVYNKYSSLIAEMY